MPCKAYSFDDCVQHHGLDDIANITEFEYNSELLCRPKESKLADNISFATFAIVVYVMSNCYIQIAEFHFLLSKSSIWGKGKPHEKEGNRAIVNSSVFWTSICLILYVVSCLVVQILTTPLAIRMRKMVVGISQLFSAVVFLMLSVHVPQWFGIYYSNKNTMVSFTSERGIRFYLSWNLSKQIFSMYFFHLLFSCSVERFSIIFGILLGVVVGMLSIRVTKFARSKKYAHRKKLLAIISILFYTILSSFCFLAGTSYISEVWVSNGSILITFLISLAWVVVVIVTHVVVKRWTEGKLEEGASMRFKSEVFNADKLGRTIFSIFTKDVTHGSSPSQIPEGVEVADTDLPNDKVDGINVTTQSESIVETKERDVKFVEDDDSLIEGADKKGEETLDRSNIYIGPEEAPSYWTLYMNQLVFSYPYLCCCLNEKYGLANIPQKRLDYIDRAREKTKFSKFWFEFKRVLWYLSSFGCFFFTIVNIGATYQQCAAREALPHTFKLLYPPDYLNGTMCAWDAPGPNATIKTFESLQDVYDVDYEVVHCGACGRCSNWNDITLQYTTKEVLAAITAQCAKKAVGRSVNVSDPEDPVVMCNRLLVGFTPECAMSWTWDEVNTARNSFFVYIQANIANYFVDMEVTYQDITLATIDEAISGPRFVTEVGATRRRMNIKSDIQRPMNQQCTVIEQNWDGIFVDPFIPPIGGTYTVQRPGQPAKKVTVIGQDPDLLL